MRRVDVRRERDLDLREQRRVVEVEQDVAGVGQLHEPALGRRDQADVQVVARLHLGHELGDLLRAAREGGRSRGRTGRAGDRGGW